MKIKIKEFDGVVMKDGTDGAILEIFDNEAMMIDVKVGEDYDQQIVKIADIKTVRSGSKKFDVQKGDTIEVVE